MKGTTKLKLKVEVELELDFDFNPLFNEVNILNARILAEEISPRKVYASMTSGAYHYLDSMVKGELQMKFRELEKSFATSPASDFPTEEFRSVPTRIDHWANIMRSIKNCGIPVRLASEAANILGAHIEPVLCRVPTAYLWPQDPSMPFDMTEVKAKMNTAKAVDIEPQPDGSVKVTWKQQG